MCLLSTLIEKMRCVGPSRVQTAAPWGWDVGLTQGKQPAQGGCRIPYFYFLLSTLRKTQREDYTGSKHQPLHPQVSLSVIEINALIWICIYLCLQSLPKHPWLESRSLIFQKRFFVVGINMCRRNTKSVKLSWLKMKRDVSATLWQETIRDLVYFKGC